jgi:DNA-binding transcriptional regulator YiaG
MVLHIVAATLRGLRQNTFPYLNIVERDRKLPNIAAVLKEEISRLARKEVRSQTMKLQKAVAHYRRDIAALKRHSTALKMQLAALARSPRKASAADAEESSVTGIRFTSKGVRSHRSLLDISAADYGKLIGVTGHTIYKWEQGGARPRQAQLKALVGIRGLRKKEAAARLAGLNSKTAGARKKKR